MVVGNGMVAINFAQYQDREDVVIFASGISNSKLALKKEFEKEHSLLEKIILENPDKKLVYFSTFNLFDPKERTSPYCLHKLYMEKYIELNIPQYNIFRLGHVAGESAKQYTILSFLYNAIKEGNRFDLWENASRNIIDIKDISLICSFIIDHNLFLNQITNICNSTNTSIFDIVHIMEQILEKKGVYDLIDNGGCPIVNNQDIYKIAQNLGIHFGSDYALRVIKKYYE